MARAFPLAGLLRLRQTQQEAAASDLAAANNRRQENLNRTAEARSTLEATPSDVGNAAALRAVAAARAASRSMLAELEATGDERQGDVERAQAAFQAVRAQSIGLEKLEGRHAEAVAAEERQTEQGVLDEIASSSWQRGGTS